MGRHAPEPMPTISVISTKWSETARSLLTQAWRALLITVMKLRKSEYSSTRANSRADQNSPPRSFKRLIRSKAFDGIIFGSLLITYREPASQKCAVDESLFIGLPPFQCLLGVVSYLPESSGHAECLYQNLRLPDE